MTMLSCPDSSNSRKSPTRCNASATSGVNQLLLYPAISAPPITRCPNIADMTCGAQPRSPANVAVVRRKACGVTEATLISFSIRALQRGQFLSLAPLPPTKIRPSGLPGFRLSISSRACRERERRDQLEAYVDAVTAHACLGALTMAQTRGSPRL